MLKTHLANEYVNDEHSKEDIYEIWIERVEEVRICNTTNLLKMNRRLAYY